MCRTTISNKLISIAQKAVEKYPLSDVEIGMEFVAEAVPSFLGASNDRLVKVGRYVKSLIRDGKHVQAGLENIVEECELIVSGKVKVPKRPFGKTGLEMPIVTLGCMRFQQEWGPRITNMNMVGADCQDNLVAILKQAVIEYGINHIETARGYGSSELQLGVAIKQLLRTTNVTREDLIIQTKVPPFADPKEFRKALETSFNNLQVDYVDLFAFHGLNFDEQMKWIFGGEDNCMAVIQEYVAAGKIKHVGFSTHGSTKLIIEAINKNCFDYVNLHYHYFGSYTASGGGHDGNGNLDTVKLLAEKGMGIFIISPYDKGGRLYAPSKKLRHLTLPDMEPLQFKSHWIWSHHLIYGDRPMLHTFTVGAARPSDLDQPAVAAYLQEEQNDRMVEQTRAVVARLEEAKSEALGPDWATNWWKGLRKASENTHFVEHNQIVWQNNVVKAFGMYEFAKARYSSFESNGKKWDDNRSPEENINDIGKNGWGFVPGIPLKEGVNYSTDFVDVPPENLAGVIEAESFVKTWLASKPKEDGSEDEKSEEEKVPDEWTTAYDMRTWPDYPDQPSRK